MAGWIAAILIVALMVFARFCERRDTNPLTGLLALVMIVGGLLVITGNMP